MILTGMHIVTGGCLWDRVLILVEGFLKKSFSSVLCGVRPN